MLTAIATVAAVACSALAAPASGSVGGEYLYWPNGFYGESIARANADGTGVNLSFITGTSATKVAVDAHYVYWANETNNQVGTIGRANLDGSAPNLSFITGVDRPGAVAVDGDHVYWCAIIRGRGGPRSGG